MALGACITAIRYLVSWIGDLQTFGQIARNRGKVMNALHDLFLNPWVGPLLVVSCLICYLLLEIGFLKLPNRKASKSAQETIGADIEGGSFRMRRSSIRNKDKGIKGKNAKIDVDDSSIE